jgi:hypothetical protein
MAGGALLAAVLALGIPQAGAQTSQSCGWVFRLSGDQVNAAFPDQAARYWVADLPIPPGFHVEVDGRYPHARYISFITYDPATRAIDGLHDTLIAPDPGSINPFVAGASRTQVKRSYKVYVRNEAVPAGGRAQNTLYTDNGQPPPQTKTSQPTQTATLIYRVYEPDQGLDITGAVGLPDLILASDDGTRREQLPACPDHSLPSTQTLTDGVAAAGPGAGSDGVPSAELGGQDPPVWLRYSNAVNGVANSALNNPRTGAAWPVAQQATNTLPSGGFYENVDNAYMTAFDTSSYGDILVFHGKAPTTPQTYLPSDTTMRRGQLRYWSMCSNMSSTQYLACVKDDDVALDGRGYYTVVISTAANRPATANPSCGIEWLPKGPLPSAPIILRNMLPDPKFKQAIQDVPAQGREQAVLGPYYPLGYYFDHASNFDAFVKANGGCGRFAWPRKAPVSYRPAGVPGLG